MAWWSTWNGYWAPGGRVAVRGPGYAGASASAVAAGGRGEQLAALEEAVAEAAAELRAGVLVSGAAGVGKTALAEQLRPRWPARGGWFVAGKFDAWRRDLEFDAT